MSYWKVSRDEIKRATKLLKGEEEGFSESQITQRSAQSKYIHPQRRRDHRSSQKPPTTDKQIAAGINNRIRAGIHYLNRGIRIVRACVHHPTESISAN
jgi:hypothetical protein